jgi:plasmid stabilization system protein ParE
LSYYEEEAGPEVAGRFETEFRAVAAAIEENPQRFHRVAGSSLRRANFRSFPYHLLFDETPDGPRITVLRHPDFGMKRE